MAFRLTKWYGDGVSAEGVCRIGYWASLKWGAVRVRYAAVLEDWGETRWTVRAGEGPRAEGGGYRWEEPALGVDWRWEGGSVGHTERWMEGVEWTCLLAGARAEVGFAGEGYLEKLEMKVAPWRLGLKELRWGRYVGGGEAWVWVDWKGEFDRKLVLRNGEKVEGMEVEDVLGLRGGRVLRSGRLETVPGLAGLLPGGMARVEETKWLSRGPGGGWAVHEVVKWPK